MDHILLSNFEGPMDLLLHLVKQTKLDIYEVNISEIIEKYINYINNLQEYIGAFNVGDKINILVSQKKILFLQS